MFAMKLKHYKRYDFFVCPINNWIAQVINFEISITVCFCWAYFFFFIQFDFISEKWSTQRNDIKKGKREFDWVPFFLLLQLFYLVFLLDFRIIRCFYLEMLLPYMWIRMRDVRVFITDWPHTHILTQRESFVIRISRIG